MKSFLKAKGFKIVKSSFPLYEIPNRHPSKCSCVVCGKIFEAWFEDVYAPTETRICRECYLEGQKMQLACIRLRGLEE